MKAHASQITAIEAVGGKIISGGKDKRIAIIEAKNGNFKLEKFIDLSASFPKSLDLFNGNLLVGLRNGSIVEFKEALTAENVAEKILMQSHFEGEVWGLELLESEKKTAQKCFLYVEIDYSLLSANFYTIKQSCKLYFTLFITYTLVCYILIITTLTLNNLLKI